MNKKKLEEKINKSQTRRKRNDESFAISKTNLKFMKIFYSVHGLFVFVTHTINTTMFCFIF